MMTNEEAIKAIEVIRNYILKDPSWLKSFTDKANEAVDMAINALKALVNQEQHKLEYIDEDHARIDGKLYVSFDIFLEAVREAIRDSFEKAEQDSPRLFPGDAISRCKLFNELANVWSIDEVYAVLQGMETLEPTQQEERTAHWEWNGIQPPTCSGCGGKAFGLHVFDATTTKYCPHCGARMVDAGGDQDETEGD